MNERMKTFIYCAITAVVTTIVVSANQPSAAQAQTLLPSEITHIIKFGSAAPISQSRAGDLTLARVDQLRTLIIKKQ